MVSPAAHLVVTSALARIYRAPEGYEEWDQALVQGTIARVTRQKVRRI